MIKAFVAGKIGPSEYLGVAKNVKEKIVEIPGVLNAETVFGRYDVIVELEAKDLKELDHITDKISSIPSVTTTETLICYSS